jgi:hypothetical protein
VRRSGLGALRNRKGVALGHASSALVFCVGFGELWSCCQELLSSVHSVLVVLIMHQHSGECPGQQQGVGSGPPTPCCVGPTRLRVGVLVEAHGLAPTTGKC